VAKRVTLQAARRTGVAVGVKADAAGRVTATAKVKRTKLGSAAAKVGASGEAKVRIRFSPKAARLLHGRKAARVTISVRFTPAGGTPVTRDVRLTLTR
jgi:hypothetical protein